MINKSIEADDRGLVSACPNCGQPNRLIYPRLGQKFRCPKCQTNLAPPGEAIEVKDESVFQALTAQSRLPVLVDFWAPWCGPCRALSPTIEKLAVQYAGRVKVGKLNTDDNGDMAVKYGISGIPQVLIFKGGDQPKERLVGLQSEQALVKVIDRVIES